ncbi:alpha-N-acetylglucosaminidase [Arachidicoccus sp.]|uniref:alpha-N-acetylglucosaminidase n=1 Tax=Arachidicoccus sp. TaxID=1872624 RepID=UPI003D225075
MVAKPFYRNLFGLGIFCLFSVQVFSQSFSSVQKIIERRFPAIEGKVVFEKLNISGLDSATYFVKNGQLHIAASTTSAASYALYDYVKKYCHSSLSHTGDNVQIPKVLPATKTKIGVHAAYPLRYALNYCTYNYTMSFWNWQQWERELDWMALNGVNLMLAPIGTEAVWQRTLEQLSFSDKEIRDFIPGPAFNAWWQMGNLEGWGGPVSDAMINHWTSLQKKILARMKALGIEPVVQGFVGIVPSALKRHFPEADIINQGNWCGFQRPNVLAAKDSLFKKVANLYYKNFKLLYGGDFKYLGGDLFHEGGKTSAINLAEEGKLVQQNMQQNFPGATWVLQGWQDNPKAKMMTELNPKLTLIIDLLGDRTETWLQRNQYGNFPWIWSTISNFGGKTTTGGTLLRVLTEPKKAERIFGKKCTLQGTGIIPEGIENNAIIYQWTLDGAWEKTVPSIQNKLADFVTSRYGENNKDLNEAWQYLLQTIYNGREPGIQGGQGGYESIFCARPDTNFIATTSCCGPTRLWFDPELLVQAALHLSKVAGQFKGVGSFQYDLVDTWRQVINLKARDVYALLMEAYRKNDVLAFEKNKENFNRLLLLQDRWLGTNENFRVGKWLNEAKNLLPDGADKKLCELNARTQITYWGPNDSRTMLHEYANKEWQGILKDLYYRQWQQFFMYAEAKMEGKRISYPDFFTIEKRWSELQNEYTVIPQGDAEAMLPQLIKLSGYSFDLGNEKEVDFFHDK